MDDLTRTFLEEGKNIRLTAEERSDIRSFVQRHIASDVSSVSEAQAIEALREGGSSLSAAEHAYHRSVLNAFVSKNPVSAPDLKRQGVYMDNKKSGLSRSDNETLSPDEKKSMREQLSNFMKQCAAADQPLDLNETFSFRAWVVLLLQGILPRTLLLACVFLLIGRGVAFAAEDSVPGDWLYALKVDIYEPIRERLIFSAQRKAQWESERAIRRLEEAEHLATTDALTEDVWNELRGNFARHVTQAGRHIDEVAEDGDSETALYLSADLETFLRAHYSIIGAISEEKKDDAQVLDMIENIETTHESLRENAMKKYVQAADPSQSERRKLDAQSKIKEVRQALKSLQTADEEEGRSAEKWKESETMMQKAAERFDAGSYEEASSLAREATFYAEEAKVLQRLPVRLPRSVIDTASSGSSSSSASSTSSYSSDSSDSFTSSISSIASISSDSSNHSTLSSANTHYSSAAPIEGGIAGGIGLPSL